MSNSHGHQLARQALSIATLFITMLGLQAQQETGENIGSWMVIAGKNDISKRWSIPTVGIIRTDRLMEKTAFGFFRTGITYARNSKFNYTIGAAYLDTQPFHHTEFETLTTQVWGYEEFVYNTKLHRFSMNNRWRLEQRWITTSNASIFNTRLRYRLQLSHPIAQQSYIKISDEPFYDITKGILNQNRFFIGVGKRITPNLALELGYLKTHLGKNNFDMVRMALLFKTKLYKERTTLAKHSSSLSYSQ